MILNAWKDEDTLALNCCVTMADIGAIAINVARRLREVAVGRMVYQLCGPMSTGGLGSLDANMRAFQRAVEILQRKGFVMFNQMPLQDAMVRIINGRGQNGYAHDILEDVYRPLFGSGCIDKTFFLPGWQTSTGARWERGVVTSFGIQVIEYPNYWYKQALQLAGIAVPSS